jgi:hypothetical protein
VKRILIAIACLLLGFAFVTPNAKADNFNLVIGDDYYVGSIVDSIPSAQELTYVKDLITLDPGTGDTTIGTQVYNREDSDIAKSELPVPTTMLKTDTDTSPPVIVNGWTYILGKYDAEKAGALVFLLTELDAGDTVTLPQDFNGHDISHYSVFNGVPDGGVTLMLLGGALVVVEALRRRLTA